MHTKRGFTLIELMVVVAVIGILAAIAIPLLGNVTDGAKQRACANNRAVLESQANAEEMSIQDQRDANLAMAALLKPYTGKNGGSNGKGEAICPGGGIIRFMTRPDGMPFLYCEMHDGSASLSIINGGGDPAPSLLDVVIGTDVNDLSKTYTLLEYFTRSLSARNDGGTLRYAAGKGTRTSGVDSTGPNFGSVAKEGLMKALGLPDTNFDFQIMPNAGGKSLALYIFPSIGDAAAGDAIPVTKYVYSYAPKSFGSLSSGSDITLSSVTEGTGTVDKKEMTDTRNNKSVIRPYFKTGSFTETPS